MKIYRVDIQHEHRRLIMRVRVSIVTTISTISMFLVSYQVSLNVGLFQLYFNRHLYLSYFQVVFFSLYLFDMNNKNIVEMLLRIDDLFCQNSSVIISIYVVGLTHLKIVVLFYIHI